MYFSMYPPYFFIIEEQLLNKLVMISFTSSGSYFSAILVKSFKSAKSTVTIFLSSITDNCSKTQENLKISSIYFSLGTNLQWLPYNKFIGKAKYYMYIF